MPAWLRIAWRTAACLADRLRQPGAASRSSRLSSSAESHPSGKTSKDLFLEAGELRVEARLVAQAFDPRPVLAHILLGAADHAGHDSTGQVAATDQKVDRHWPHE